DAAAERARHSRRVISGGDALARSGAGGLYGCGHRHRCGAGAGRPGPGADDRRKRCRQQPQCGGGYPAADAVHAARELSGTAIAFDPNRLHALPASRRRATDWPLLRRSHAAADRRRVPARHRLSSTGTQGGMTNLVEIRDLNIRFTGERTVHAVTDLSLSLGEGEVLGLLGESGSGKSVTLRALMRLLPKKRTLISGSVNVLGRGVLAANSDDISGVTRY